MFFREIQIIKHFEILWWHHLKFRIPTAWGLKAVLKKSYNREFFFWKTFSPGVIKFLNYLNVYWYQKTMNIFTI